MKKLDYIDSIRGLAILGVIMIHASLVGKLQVPGPLRFILAEGTRGVQLFYIASAFTLFRSFKSRSSVESFPVRNFFVRRFFRIAPMYYLAICYYLFQDGLGPKYWLGDAPSVTPLTILSNVTFLHGFNPYWINSVVPGGWSIAVEMMFYAVLPFMFSRLKSINQAFNLFVFSIVLDLLLRLVLYKFMMVGDQRLWSEYLYFYFPSQLPVFCLGVIMFFIVHQKQSLSAISGKSLLVFCALLLLHFSTGKPVIPEHIIFSICFLILGVGLSIYPTKILVNRVIQHIGKISFSMYLVHIAVLHMVTKLHLVDLWQNGLINYASNFSTIAGFTIVISTITYYSIEVPLQNLGKNIISKWEMPLKPASIH